jgi:uncharacterized protein YndB with AHSA1/START domain
MPSIIVQSFIAAPGQVVWDALFARTDLLFDGLPADTWPAGDEQPPFHTTVEWPYTRRVGSSTSVSVTLHEVGDGTRVDVRHEGWGEGPAWDVAIQGHFAGWLQGLASLGTLLESGADPRVADAALQGRERYFISGEIPAAASAVYRSLVDPAVLARWSGGLFVTAERVQEIEDKLVRWRAPAGGEVVVQLRATPRGTHLALAEYGVTDRAASTRWPAMFENLTRFLS